MPDFYALMWDVKPGSEESVAKLFENYGKPDYVIRDQDGNEKGRLLSTLVFMKDTTVVRVMEIEGVSLPEAAAHMGKQPAVKELEEQLDEHLATPRDMSNPQGAAKFFMESSMRTLLARRSDE